MGYITKAEKKKSHKRFIKECKESEQKQIEQWKRDENIIVAQLMERRKEEERRQQEKELFIAQAKQFVTYAAKTLPYKEYLIAWDIANSNHYQIESDINSGKITSEQFQNVYTMAKEYINNLCDALYNKFMVA